MWIDSHCHLDAAEFLDTSITLANDAYACGVQWIVLPAVCVDNFNAVENLAAHTNNCVYALGIHPMYVEQADENDLTILRERVAHAMLDNRFIAIGEIGLDFFVQEIAQGALREKQIFFYREQLKIARDFNLPVLLHTRRAVDVSQKHLREINVLGGIAHAFNGSVQQAHAFTQLNFKLGFGGAMTFTRALQIRRLAIALAIDDIVLETDAPDMAPSWCKPDINRPQELVKIGEILAELRQETIDNIARATSNNAMSALPRLRALATA